MGRNWFFLLIFFLSFSLSFFHSAQGRELEIKYPEILGIKPETVEIGLGEFFKYLYNLSILLAGLVILIALLQGGIKYLTSAGNVAKLSEAREQIFSSFLGIIILLASYIILSTINPELTLFEFPKLEILPKLTVTPTQPVVKEKVSIIYQELPYGQSIKNGLWKKERRKKLSDLAKDDEEFFKKAELANLGKSLKTLAEACNCEECKGRCAEPQYNCTEIGCFGDPCPEETRKKINKAINEIDLKVKKILEFKEKIEKEREGMKRDFEIFSDIEGEILSCQEKRKSLLTLNEYLVHSDFAREQNWIVEKVTLPSAPPSKGDPLTFYCASGGTLFDYPYYLGVEGGPEIPSELELPEVPGEKEATVTGCPVEIPLGEIIDELRILATQMLLQLKKLANLHFEISSQMEKMKELLSQCSCSRCKIKCHGIPNLCFGCCVSPPCPPNCPSKCLFLYSGCQPACVDENGPACPLPEMEETIKKIKEFEDEIFLTLKKIKEIIPKVESLLESRENPWNLENVKNQLNLCKSENIEEPSWFLLSCEEAKENYGPKEEIILNCHPRNFFCCTNEGLTFPGQPIPRPKELIYKIPPQKYPPLEAENNCPKGWLCDSDVANYNQYNDASEELKSFLACMREVLDKIEKEYKIGKKIGRISSISDSKIYQGTCDWLKGPLSPFGCSHTYEVKYQGERVSAHYGGLNCRHEKKSYAVDLGDEENFEYISEAVAICEPRAYLLLEKDHVHLSISQIYGCGAK